MKQIFFSLAMLLLTVVSCKKEDKLSLGPGPQGKRLKSITVEQGGMTSLVYQFNYNTDGNIASCNKTQYSRVATDSIESGTVTHKYYYGANGKMNFEVIDSNTGADTCWYSYDDAGRLKKVEHINQKGLIVESVNNIYFGVDSMHTKFFVGVGGITTHYYFSFDSTGNITEMKYSNASNPVQTAISNASYDDLYNVYSYIRGMQSYNMLFGLNPLTLSFNNITKYRTDGWDGPFTFEYNYTLDNWGMVVERKHTTDVGDEVERFEYERF